MKSLLYLLIDLGCVFIPLVFSFHPKIRFDKEWRYFLPANLLVGVVFLIWDEYFTRWGVWGFNPDYLTGWYMGELPIEEILFFLCIPYACTFTYFVIKKYKKSFFLDSATPYLHGVMFLLVLVLLILGYPKLYTSVTMVGLLLFLPLLYRYFSKNTVYLYSMYLLIVPPFLLSNGILTGSFLDAPIVWYNNEENLNFRIFTIPIEDFFYGFLLLSLNDFTYEKFKYLRT